MKETSTQPSIPDRIRSWTRTHGGTRPSVNDSNLLPVSTPSHGPSIATIGTSHAPDAPSAPRSFHPDKSGLSDEPPKSEKNAGHGLSTPTPSSQAVGPGPVVTEDAPEDKVKKNVAVRFWNTTKVIMFNSKINLLLVFVPIGIVVANISGMPPAVIFAMNAVAIIPLAGLLSFATETVARKLGDSLGALLNVTFGNAVELIIFIIALVKNEIRIVQASLLGSILANLLLILGMSFVLGGLRFREQIYNSTVTQMSACLLSLSVISLVLPTAFHATFKDIKKADSESLKISRGTSVILLLVYIIYLLFQLRSHAYMYESTPQHIIDEEATPGPVANWLDSSSSDDSSSSSSDSSDSERSRETVSKRVKRVMRGNRRRKSSNASVDTGDKLAGPTRTPSFGTDTTPGTEEATNEATSSQPVRASVAGTQGDDEETGEEEKRHKKRRHRYSRKHRKHKHKSRREPKENAKGQAAEEVAESRTTTAPGEPRRVDFAVSGSIRNGETTVAGSGGPAGPPPLFALRGMSLRPVAKSLAPTVFSQSPDPLAAVVPAGPVPRVRYGIRRTNSLPDRLTSQYRSSGAMMPSQIPTLADIASGAIREKVEDQAEIMSRTSAVVLLLISTALVAVCAEFMVDSINGLVATSHIGEIFIGLIVLPIVGNAAEHVTAITVAMKNKMDLAIGVAVGSSIQIALFITPLIVIIGWAMDREMTLYFTLFETVCLFAAAFITNFLILDGRSNYLEGSLLVATYVIIGVIAFFYPSPEDSSSWGA